MAKTKTKTKPTPRASTERRKVTVVNTRSFDPPRRRHIGTTTKYPKPLCAEYGYKWTASSAAKYQTLPICKRCATIVEELHAALMTDPTRLGYDELLGLLDEMDGLGK